MVKYKKKGHYKALSILLAIVMILATPLGTIQIYALEEGHMVTSPSAISILEEDTTPPVFADGSPKQYGEPLHPGCKHVKMTVAPRDDEEVTAYYVAVEHNATSPTNIQVKEGKNSENNKAIRYGSQDNVKVNGYIISPGKLPADDTIYDFWCVLEDVAGNLSEPKKVELKTPVKILTDGYPRVGSVQADGSKQVEVLVKSNGSATAYYVAVVAGATAPKDGYIMRGEDSTGEPALAAGNLKLEADTQASLIVTLGEDFANYDVYVVLYEKYHGGGFVTDIWSEVVGLEVTTPDMSTSKLWEVSNAEELENALRGFQNTDTIQLAADIDYNFGISVSENFTLDFQNYNLTVTNATGIGFEVKDATITVSGTGDLNVTGKSGVRAYNGTVIVDSATGTDGYGVLAQGGGKVEVKTRALGTKEGAYSTGAGSEIIAVEAVATAENGKAVLAELGGDVEILGNATANDGYGVYCMNGKSARVSGNVTGKNPAVYLYEKGEIVINGDVNTDDGNGTAIEIGSSSNPTGTVTISGSVLASVDKYILFSSNYQAKSSGVLDPGMSGYLKYTDKSGAEQDGVVWIKGIESLTTIDVGDSTQLETALTLVPHGGTIRLTENIDYNKGISIQHKTVNFDLNGFTLNVTNSDGAGLEVISGIVIAKGSGAMNVTGTNYGLWAWQDSPRMTMVNITNATATEGAGIGAFDPNTDVVVSGNAEGGSFGVYSPSGSSVRVGRDVRGVDCGVSVLASWLDFTEVLVRGNVVVTGPNGVGAKTSGDCTIIVDGSINAKGCGVYNSHGGEIIVRSNIDVSGLDGIGAEMIGLGNVTINGILTAATYIKIDEKILQADNYVIDDKKPNYLKYAVRDDQVVWVLKRSAPETYTLNVQNGTGSGSYEKDATVTITANDTFDGQQFKEWIITPSVTFEGDTTKTSQTVQFKMPAQAVTAMATYEAVPIPVVYHNVTVNSSHAETSGAGNYEQGATVTINAGSRSGYTFTGWTTSDGTVFANKNSETTTFIMPAQDVTIVANWSYNVIPNDDNEGSDDSSDESSDESSYDSSSGDSKVTVNVSDQSIIDAIKVAQDAAQKNGNEKDGIAIIMNLSTDNIASNLSINLTQNAMNELVKAEVKELQFTNSIVTIVLDLTALKQLKQAGGNIAIIVNKIDVNSLSIQCNGKTISDFGESGNLYAVYVDGVFSIFGIGYKADLPVFIDTTVPDTKKYISYVVKRGDTLWGIAKKYNCKVGEIVALNSELIRNPNLIFAGWSLNILQE